MNITDFFNLSAGKWFSQRTVHHLTSGKLIAGKSNLVIESLQPSDAAVVKLCQQCQSETTAVWGGIRFSWDGTVEGNPKKQIGSTLLVPVPHPDKQNEGIFLQEKPNFQTQSLQGRYILDQDEVLTLITESEEFYAEDRLWYLIPNLRLRTSVVKRKNGLDQASFCSEIRMGMKS